MADHSALNLVALREHCWAAKKVYSRVGAWELPTAEQKDARMAGHSAQNSAAWTVLRSAVWKGQKWAGQMAAPMGEKLAAYLELSWVDSTDATTAVHSACKMAAWWVYHWAARSVPHLGGAMVGKWAACWVHLTADRLVSPMAACWALRTVEHSAASWAAQTGRNSAAWSAQRKAENWEFSTAAWMADCSAARLVQN